MERPTLEDARDLAGARVRIVVPKPREDQRLQGVVRVDGERVTLEVDGGSSAESDRFGTVELRERERDSVLRAYRGDDLLVGRVGRLSKVDE